MSDRKKVDRLHSQMPSLRALILEDTPQDARLTASVLESGGFRVQFEVSDSLDFFRESLKKTDYDVIIADYNLQTWTAIDALETLRLSGKDIPLIVMTGSLGDEAAAECIKQGAADFVLKDRPARLPTAVQRALQERRLRGERKRAEEELKESERRYRRLHESMMDGFVRVDLEGRIVETNDAFCKMLGYSSQELQGLTYNDLTPEKWQGSETDIIEEEVFTKGYSEVYFKEYQRKTGAIIPVEVRKYLLLDEAGNPSGVWAIVRDITERKWAEEMLQEYERVVEGTDEMIAVVDKNYRYLLANRAYLNQVELELAEVIGSNVPEVLGQEFFERVVKPHLDDCFQGKVVRSEAKYPYRHLGEKDILASYFPIESYRGVDRAACVLQDITGRKRADAALIEERHLLYTLMDNLPDVIYFKDRESRFTRINQALAKMFGLSDPSQAVGITDFDVFSAEHAQGAYKDEQEIIRTGNPVVDKEEKEVRPDGRVNWVSSTKMPLRDANGNIIGTFGISRDITERKRAEDAIIQSEERYRTLFENAPVGIYRTTPDGVIVAANPALVRMLGYSSFTELAKRDLNAGGFEPGYPRNEFMELLEEKGEVAGLEAEWRRKNGEVLHVRENARAVHDHSGKVLYYEGTVEDITKQKKAEAEHIRLVTAIEQSEEAVVMTNSNGKIEYVNPAFTRMTGYSREEALGQNPRILKSGKQDPEVYQQLWETLLRGQTWHGEIVNQRKNGSLYTEQMSVTPVRGPRNEVTHFIATKQDVTERRALEAQLQQAAKMEAIGRLAGGIAHDFNNLLTIINGYTELLLDKFGPAGQTSEYLKEVKDAGERAAALTRQLLAFSRRQVLMSQIVDLNSIVSNLEKMLRRLIGEDIKLHTVLDPSIGRVKADAGQIEQVIMNLAVNARDAMPSGGNLTFETRNVELDENYARSHVTVNPGPHVLLAVSDTGVGMTPEIRARIFEPFFTTKEQGKGTGLGLATVYGIVKQSGGSVWVYSEPGQGTVFKVYFPAVIDSATPREAAIVEAGSDVGSETILVVEDEEGVRSLVRLALESRGYKILETESAEIALATCANHDGPIHLLLTDVVMPQMSGPKVAEKITAMRPGIKVIYMSGYTDDAVVHHGVLNRDLPFIQKPFSPVALGRKVREVLGGK